MNLYKDFFCCECGSLQFKCLDTPIDHRRFLNREWMSVVDRFEIKLYC